MNTSGRPREGWMALVPLAAFAAFVVAAAGGPKAFVNSATYWLRDAVDYCVRFVKSFS
ncbi:MAG TPA: hypothetical protein VJ813_06585 [Vicinamibacterales bacterium]|nr:hypothetical protein [Vicinamibacterales bacterium]